LTTPVKLGIEKNNSFQSNGSAMQIFRTKIFARSVLATVLATGVAIGSTGAFASAVGRPTASHTLQSHQDGSVHFAGEVTAYTPASGSTNGSLTLLKRNGATLTYSTTSATTITQLGGLGAVLAVGDHASVVATSIAPTVAVTIIFAAARPISFSGRVTAYTAASGSTNGSITVRRRSRAILTFATTSSTTITEVHGSGDTIAVRDWVKVEASASASTIATSITFRAAPPIRFQGKVTAYTPAAGSTNGSISLTNYPGAALTFAVTSTTVITEVDGSGDTLAVGDHAVIEAAAEAKTVATSITFNLPPSVTFTGYVTAYTAATSSANGSISLEKSDSKTDTFVTTLTTTITEIGGAGGTLTVGDHASITTLSGSPGTAATIKFTPEPPSVEFSGYVTAYTAPVGSTNGSITLRKRNGATLTYSTTLSTTITEVGGTGATLAVADWATVRADAADKTAATSITFTPAPPISFSGRVTAYTAAVGTTDGSISLTNHAGASLTFSTTSSTAITEKVGSGQTLTVGDQATVQAAAAAKGVATSITFTPAAPVAFTGKITAYSAASSSTDGSISLTNSAGASLTFSTTLLTVITQVGGSGGTLGVGDHATVVAPFATPTIAASITFRV